VISYIYYWKRGTEYGKKLKKGGYYGLGAFFHHGKGGLGRAATHRGAYDGTLLRKTRRDFAVAAVYTNLFAVYGALVHALCHWLWRRDLAVDIQMRVRGNIVHVGNDKNNE